MASEKGRSARFSRIRLISRKPEDLEPIRARRRRGDYSKGSWNRWKDQTKGRNPGKSREKLKTIRVLPPWSEGSGQWRYRRCGISLDGNSYQQDDAQSEKKERIAPSGIWIARVWSEAGRREAIVPIADAVRVVAVPDCRTRNGRSDLHSFSSERQVSVRQSWPKALAEYLFDGENMMTRIDEANIRRSSVQLIVQCTSGISRLW